MYIEMQKEGRKKPARSNKAKHVHRDAEGRKKEASKVKQGKAMYM